MEFANSERVWLLALCVLLAGWAARGRGIRARGWRSLGYCSRVPRDGAWLALLACAALSLALMRPRGLGRGEGPAGVGRDVVLAVDVSRSMAVEDAVPNRLGAAVDAAQSLLKALAADPASRAGVVAFAGKGVVRCPLTENLGAVAAALKRLKPGCVQPGGTDLAAAVEASLELFQPDEPSAGRAVVIFSDGEDHEKRWRGLEKRLAESTVAIHAVAVGDDQTARQVPFDSPDAHLVYHGRPVESRRVDQALIHLVHQTGGTFVPLGVSTTDLGALYVSRIEPASRRSTKTPINDRRDWFPVLLFCALVPALASRWPPVANWPRFAFWRGRETKPAKPASAAALGLAGLVLAMAAGAADGPSDDREAAAAVAQGNVAYRAGRFGRALEHFERAAGLAPGRAVPLYDVASTLFQQGRIEEALANYWAARETADPVLRAKIAFALGNAALSLGEAERAVASYDDCLASTARGPGLDRIRRDAAENRAYALERLKSPGAPEPPDSDHAATERTFREDPARNEEHETETPAKKGPGAKSPQSGGSQPRSASGRSRAGGAGGSNSQGSSSPGQSPDDRLNDALDKIQDALDDRLPDDAGPARLRDDRKDW